MIVTLTPNPSVDRTVEVDALERGRVLRARSVRVDAGGKGVNVARALGANGVATLAILPSGGVEGGHLTRLLKRARVEVALVPIEGDIRANVSIVEPDGTVTKINEPGPSISAPEAAAIASLTLDHAATGEWVAVCGSLPPGLDDGFYAELVAALVRRGARVALDASGIPFQLGVGARPHVVKPNLPELEAATGTVLETLGDVVDAAHLLLGKGAAAVLASLGPDGAVLVDSSGPTHGEAPVANPRNAVGAGDAMLAGFLAGGGSGAASLAEALAWGAAATSLPGSRMPGPADLDRARVHIHDHIDHDRVLGTQN